MIGRSADKWNTTALWRRDWVERARVSKAPELERVVVGVDPAVSSGLEANETGIVVAGVDFRGHLYVLDDRSLRASPDTWARRAIAAYRDAGADRLIAEANQGGELVVHTLKMVDATASIKFVHATRGKRTRAEPIAALYEQGRVHHVGTLATLEDQLCLWEAHAGAPSPDRLDALVWALTELVERHNTILYY
jgi:phage terminase large subunit-like protein